MMKFIASLKQAPKQVYFVTSTTELLGIDNI
jgi:hypothetical protein